MHNGDFDMMASVNTTIATCASCGKEGGNLNTCNKCNMVKYCNAACKKKHRSKHKKACERRVAELHVHEELFIEHPPREDCPICFLPLPLRASEMEFRSCCGKIICNGCIYAIAREEAIANGRKKWVCVHSVNSSTQFRCRGIQTIIETVEADNAHVLNILAGVYATGDSTTRLVEG